MRIKEPLITLTYIDDHGHTIKRFDDAWSLSIYFQKECHPDIAKAFKYEPRPKKVVRRPIEDLWDCLNVFNGRDFVNNVDPYDIGRIIAQNLGFIKKLSNGYELTQSGKNFIDAFTMMKKSKE